MTDSMLHCRGCWRYRPRREGDGDLLCAECIERDNARQLATMRRSVAHYIKLKTGRGL